MRSHSTDWNGVVYVGRPVRKPRRLRKALFTFVIGGALVAVAGHLVGKAPEQSAARPTSGTRLNLAAVLVETPMKSTPRADGATPHRGNQAFSDLVFGAPVHTQAFEKVDATPNSVLASLAPTTPEIPVPPINPGRAREPSRADAATATPKSLPTTQTAKRPQTTQVAKAEPAKDDRNFFQKLFGQPSAAEGETLAYARPDDGGALDVLRRFDQSAPKAPVGDRTAVYDISAKTVYLPSGKRLEAHSGLGPMMDDPKSYKTRMRGVTPPNVYNLTMREKLFHGVEAIRLNPVDESKMHGRDGMLAHTYMLGPRGDSNGCVSFRDYPEFLAAFKRGEIRRLVVVTSVSTMLASNGSIPGG